MTAISTNYRELQPEQIPEVAERCKEAWKNPELPMRQYEACVRAELNRYKLGQPNAPFDAVIRCLKQLPLKPYSVLDIGASTGYYLDVLRLRWECAFIYRGCDYSPAFKEFARKFYPEIDYDLAEATKLPYANERFDIVLTSACIMHIYEWKKAVQEAKRVTGSYVILHRTPVSTKEATKVFLKEGYGVEMFEWQFNEDELLQFCAKSDLVPIYSTDVFWNKHSGHRSYLLKKDEELFYHPV